jgi:hypothetical protein
MTRRNLVWVLLAAAATGAVALYLLWWPVVGWWRHESFYQGRPTSYWRSELDQWYIYHQPSGGKTIWRRHDPWDHAPGWACWMARDNFAPPLMDGDPAAEPVLTELLADSPDLVKRIAQEGLDNIRRQAAK